ncbi:MAG: tetratricopeptide repeat protein [Kofleriaceae bacterium]
MTAVRSVALLLALTAIAAAEPTADEYFKQGRAQLKAHKYAEACEKFERSQQLDPALGTLFNIAQCDADIGKLATALAAYRDVIAHDTNATRRRAATAAARKLESRVPRLIVKAEAGVELTLDGAKIVADAATAVDLGKHEITAQQVGHEEFHKTVAMSDEGQTVTINAKLVAIEAATAVATVTTKLDATTAAPHMAPPPSPPLPVHPTPPSRSHRRTIGIATTAVGVAALGTGAVFGILARSKWNAAKAVCGDSTTCGSQADADAAAHLGDQAHGRASLSTGFAIAGGVIATVGIVLFATSPREHAVELAARPSGDGGTLVLCGQF